METDSLADALKPFILLSRLTGVYPIFRREIKPLLLFSYSILILLILGYATFGVVLWLQEVDMYLYDSLMHLTIEKSQKCFLFLNNLTLFCATIYYHKQLEKFVSDLNKVDNWLLQIDMPIKYRLHSAILVGSFKFVILSFLIVIDYFLSVDSHWLFTAIDLIATHGPLIPIFSYELYFYASLIFISQHFKFINVKLREAITKVSFENRLEKIYNLIRIYDHLCAMSLLLNRISSIPNLITVASIFFLGIVNIHLMAISGPYNRYKLLIFLICSLLLRIFELWAIIHPYVLISKEVDQFNGIIFKTMIQDRTGDFTNDDKLYLHITMKKGIQFKAWDFFLLDYSLIQSVLGAATTLLVILIQFSLSKKRLWCEDI